MPKCTADLISHKVQPFSRSAPGEVLYPVHIATYPTDFILARQTLLFPIIISHYQSVSRSGDEVIWWTVRSAPLNSSSASRRMPTAFLIVP